MAYMITDDCSNCSACIDECPNQAISEGDSRCVIDYTKCNACPDSPCDPETDPECDPEVVTYNPKCVAVCPSNACVPDPFHPHC